MELKSTINETWKFRAFWSLVGCLITLLVLNQTHSKPDFSTLLGQFHPLITKSMINPSELAHPSLDFFTSINHTKVEKNVTSDPPKATPVSQTTKNIEKNVVMNPPKEKQAKQATDNIVKNVVLNPPKATPVNQTTKKLAQNVTMNPPKEQPVKQSNNKKSSCNIFDGKWVYKEENEPYYNSTRCPFVEEKFSCQKNGRPDSDYEKWRWEANDCDIPLFNGKDMLERLKNKKVIIVGDSLNRNQWESLACLLYSSLPDPSRAEVSAGGPTYKVIKAKDYNCTVEFYWSPFLVNFIDPHESGKKVLVLDELSPNYKQWLGADVMVFNSGHWWTHSGKLRSWDLFQWKGKLIEEMPIELAYKRAMKTWAKWMKNNVDPKKTRVFFRSISAIHTRENWCYNKTQPFVDESYNSYYPKPLIEVIEGIIKGMSKLQVKYLNVTKLSEYRRDAHPSMYRNTQWKDGTFQLAYADCSHWCLPGLPDTWNRLLLELGSFSPLPVRKTVR